MKNKNIIIGLILLLAISSCTKVQEVEYDVSPVIEAYLIPGQIVRLELSAEIPYQNTESTDVDINTLTIQISDGTNSTIMNNIKDGVYITEDSFIVEEGKSYSMEFLFGETEVYANSFVPLKPTGFIASASSIIVPEVSYGSHGSMTDFPDPINLDWDNPDGDYHMVVVECIEDDPELINDTTEGMGRPGMMFINQPDKSDFYDISYMNFSYYGTHRVILFKLNSEYAALYEDSGSTSQSLTVPPTSIVNGYGIFTGINSDTVYVDVY
jgi:hypothetical protein